MEIAGYYGLVRLSIKFNATFHEPGQYVLRCLVHTGSTFTYQNVTFNVTPS